MSRSWHHHGLPEPILNAKNKAKAKYNMKEILFFGLLSCIISTTGCNRQNKTTTIEAPAASHNEKEVFKNTKVDNANDLVCGMPLTAGVGDTAHYDGKVYGFCSKGCKEKFVKSPAEYLASQ